MKKIINSIIISSFLFTSLFTVNASDGLLWDMLEINTGIEIYALENIPSLESQYYNDNNVQNTYNKFLEIDSILRTEFSRQYRNGDITNPQMQDLVHNYKNFVYYTNKTFWYISEEEKWLRGREIQRAIHNWYSNMRLYYSNIQNIISQ